MHRAWMFPGALLALAAAGPPSSGGIIRLVDVAAQAGITLLNICGSPVKD